MPHESSLCFPVYDTSLPRVEDTKCHRALCNFLFIVLFPEMSFLSTIRVFHNLENNPRPETSPMLFITPPHSALLDPFSDLIGEEDVVQWQVKVVS